MDPKPFEFVSRSKTRDLVPLLEKEHPQISAVILKWLPEKMTMKILSRLHDRKNISERMRLIKDVDPSILREIERVYERNTYDLMKESK